MALLPETMADSPFPSPEVSTMRGYNALAGYIGTFPSLAIFRRFLILNARNLLCMQGEIINLEHGLRRTIDKDRNAEDSVRNQFEHDIEALKGPHSHPGDGLQWHRTLELRHLLRDYNEALLQFASISRLAPANKSDLSALHELLENDNGEPFVLGHEHDTWEDEHFKDLTSLASQHTERDALSKFIDKMVRTVYHQRIGHKFHDPLSVVEAWGSAGKRTPVIEYPDSYITATIDTLSTILASILPTIAAFGIYLIHDQTTRMGAIIGCTILFSSTLTLIARPKRVEVFASSAAFAAVLVVFVNSNGGAC